MRKIVFLFLISILFATTAHAKVQVVTTMGWIGSLAREIGKDKVEVVSLIKPSQDPHMIEAKPSMIVAVRKADILMYNGLDLEIGYLPRLIESSRNPKVQPGNAGNFDCSRYVTVIEKPETVDRSMGDVHPLGNPHYHYSARNVANIAAGMAKTFSELAPGDASYFNANLAIVQATLRERQARWAVHHLKGKKFLSYHKYFEYLARDFGFSIVGYVETKPGIPPSSGHIENLIEMTRKDRPAGILVTPYHGTKEVAFLSHKTGVRGIVVPHDVGATPAAKDWFTLMDQVLGLLE